VDLGSGIGADFVLVTNGDGTGIEDPLGRYTLTNDFYMMTTEVTQGMFTALLGYDSRSGQPAGFGDGPDFPAYHSNWHMAADFANALSVLEDLSECYTCTGSGTSVSCSESGSHASIYDCPGYRLPTETEWELARTTEGSPRGRQRRT
jgi:formylglycine-generating enzyme required for sulfatase activity